MAYKIVGYIKNKRYNSRKFSTQLAASRAAYAKVYQKDGNTKKKNGLYNYEIIKVK